MSRAEKWKFQLFFFLEEAQLRQGLEKAESQVWGRSVSHQPGAPSPPASPEALGFYCSRMGCNQCQEYLSAYREAKIWVICLRT